MTPDHSRMVSSSSIAGHPQYPKPWFSSCLGQKRSAWRREEKSQGKFLSLFEAKFQEPPWLDFQTPPCSPPASFPSSGEVRGGGLQGLLEASRVFHNLSIPRWWAGLTSSQSLAPAAWAASSQELGNSSQELPTPGTLGNKREPQGPTSILTSTPTSPSYSWVWLQVN